MCEGELPTLARADARTCSARCRKARSRGRIPAALRDLDRWVTWSPTKVPLTPAGRPASSTDPATWSPWSSVRGLGRRGFVLNGDGVVCLDLDHCLSEAGVLTEGAARLLALLPPTYVEVSPSGDGLHVWGRGVIDGGRVVSLAGQRVEVYGAGRYLTVTAQPFGSSPSSLGNLAEVLPLILS